MIPDGYAASIHAWATSPEVSDSVRAARRAALLAERDLLVSGVNNKGKGVREIASGSQNGKTFTFAPGVTPAEKLTVITDVLTRLGLVAGSARAITTTHANFAGLER